MNKINEIFANFVEGFTFRKYQNNVVNKSEKGAFVKAFILTLVIALISEYALLIPLNIKAPQFIIYVCFLLIIFDFLLAPLNLQLILATFQNHPILHHLLEHVRHHYIFVQSH